MKRLLGVFVVGAGLSGVVLGDDLDKQIKKLQEENKLLELQNKKQEQKNQKDTLTTAKAPKIKKSDSKSGFFVGIEGMLGRKKATLHASYRNPTDSTGNSDYFHHTSNTTFDLGIMGGYQHYFEQSQRQGIKVSAHLYSGFGNNYTFSESYELFESSDSGNIPFMVTNALTISYIPIKIGFDVKYLWDFFERGKHTLGLNVGLGYQFDSYVGGKAVFKESSSHPDFNDKRDTSIEKTIFLNNFYPIIGLHYYYGHHQIELMYRFGGIVDSKTTKTIQKQEYPDGTQAQTHLILKNQSYLALNYAYLF